MNGWNDFLIPWTTRKISTKLIQTKSYEKKVLTSWTYCAFCMKKIDWKMKSYHFLSGLALNWLCGKCIVGQSSAKFDKVDMFSKQAIKKQSWQSWCIFLSIFKNIMQSKVGKVEMWIHYSRQSWQSSDFYISNNGQSS